MTQSFKKEIVQHIFRNLLDIMVLRLLRRDPMWGYKMIKIVEEKYDVKLRQGALYPLLNNLERKGFLRSKKETKRGRVRKIYEITSKGIQLVDAYNEFMREQI